jgi:hypothetical protein
MARIGDPTEYDPVGRTISFIVIAGLDLAIPAASGGCGDTRVKPAHDERLTRLPGQVSANGVEPWHDDDCS